MLTILPSSRKSILNEETKGVLPLKRTILGMRSATTNSDFDYKSKHSSSNSTVLEKRQEDEVIRHNNAKKEEQEEEEEAPPMLSRPCKIVYRISSPVSTASSIRPDSFDPP